MDIADKKQLEEFWLDEEKIHVNEKANVVISNAIHHPSHYNEGSIECIEALKSALGTEGFRGFCSGNVIKYVWRYRHKKGLEDLQKAQWYLDTLVRNVVENADVS